MPEQKQYRTVKEFQGRVGAYFADCAAVGAYPDEAGLILHLGLEREAYDRYLSGAEGKGYAACLKKAGLKRESIIVRDIYDSEKSPTGKIFLARQENNGGLTDKPKEDGKKLTVDVRINGERTGHFD